jgi:hypothetical protein
MVDELCRRPGVTPWEWAEGPVSWPPASVECEVSLANERVTIRFEGPRQLELSEIIERVQAEYHRARERARVYPRLDPMLGHSVAMEPSVEPPTPPDAILAAIVAAGDDGCTSRELVERTGESKHRVAKRLRELKDASMVGPGRRRYSYVHLAGAERDAASMQVERSTTQTMLGLFRESQEA